MKADLWIEGRLAKVFETVEAQVLSLYVTQVFEENARRKKNNQAELTETEKEQLEKELTECSAKYGLEQFAEYQKHKEHIYEKYGIHA